MIYLDYAASTPMCDEALHIYSVMNKEMFGNASSLHDAGGQAAYTLDYSRQRMAKMIGGQKEGIYFTSGGTESNMVVVQSILNGLPPDKKHWIMSALEHHSMYNLATLLEHQGYELTIIQPDREGRITREVLVPHLRDNTGLVSIQHANSETGLIQDLAALSPLLHERGIMLHSDAVQTFGNVHIDVEAMGVDALSISSHKVYGPKGVGAAYLKPGTPWRPLYPDTLHENGFRPGTVNVPGIAAFVAAAEMMTEQMEMHQERYATLRRYFITKIQERSIPLRWVVEESEKKAVLHHIVGCFFHGYEGQYVMLECNRSGVCISTGSACAAGHHDPSPALQALGASEREALQFIRISFGRTTTIEELNVLVDILTDLTHRQERSLSR
ncbi:MULTISPECIES: IscS subfamily cysteine desulfurase [Paenibacillus]|uniref:Cysteine desulfurase n=2 Tax=Paenibacillus polymyxa TaxID=1406 RepID=A0A378XZQ1_PAEPO|nr:MULTISPECIES: IscS subfamily cysteine desulfurase [Paenibacillus]KAF6583530.1 IscS subfamily cysteine desulfurase [Paenibacillus sp. EKM211P]MBE7899978.1 IscS subfamily cysteine desulfurase [Paenibacillus polymyxa]MBG9764621.1 cysteine desulfurase [Paenibacillus polymyxa]MCC3259647.1 IscS subfamily cysteine desulfurase [Paenibacillus polymyxa]QPK55411.1 aminotransferase class V-fold PLP-dependent enzyme [Paenibacillus polymyxa]